MRSFVEGLPEEPQEMKARQASFAGDLLQVKWKVIALIDEFPGADEPLIGLDPKLSVRLYLNLVLHINQSTSEDPAFGTR